MKEKLLPEEIKSARKEQEKSVERIKREIRNFEALVKGVLVMKKESRGDPEQVDRAIKQCTQDIKSLKEKLANIENLLEGRPPSSGSVGEVE